MAAIQPFTVEQVEEANRAYADWFFYFHGGRHKWRVYSEEGGCTDPALWGKPIYEKPGPHHFLRFLDEVVWTLDEDDEEQPLKKWPAGEQYIIDYVMEVLFSQRFIVVPKSRRIRMTWIHAAYALWFGMSHPKRNVVWQAQKGDKVADTMENKILHILSHLPLDRYAPFVDANRWAIPAGWDDRVVNFWRGKRESYGLTRVTLLERENPISGEGKLTNSSRIFGVPEGADQTRQYTITLFIGDEFAFWKNPKASLKGIRPALGKNGQGILISSANPGYMQELIERPELEPGENEPPQPTPHHEGVKTWYSKQGWFVCWIHYTADAAKRDKQWTEWPDMGTAVLPGDAGYARLGMSQRDWKQEMEIDFSVHRGEPFYPEYSDAQHLQNVRAIPNQPLIIGVDFGLTPAFVVCQLTKSGHLNVVDEMVFDDNGIEEAARLLTTYLDANFPWWKGKQRSIDDDDFLASFEQDVPQEMVISYVDPAGLQRAQTDLTTPISILKKYKLNPVASIQDVVSRSEAVKELLTRSIYYASRDLRLPALLINPRCTTLVEGMRGGAKQGKIRFKKEKNEFSHVTEALEYVAVMLTSVERRLDRQRRTRQQTVAAPFVQHSTEY